MSWLVQPVERTEEAGGDCHEVVEWQVSDSRVLVAWWSRASTAGRSRSLRVVPDVYQAPVAKVQLTLARLSECRHSTVGSGVGTALVLALVQRVTLTPDDRLRPSTPVYNCKHIISIIRQQSNTLFHYLIQIQTSYQRIRWTDNLYITMRNTVQELKLPLVPSQPLIEVPMPDFPSPTSLRSPRFINTVSTFN